MITFHQASPTVFMYETTPSYWQDRDSDGRCRASCREDASSKRPTSTACSSATTSGATTSGASGRSAFSNFSVTDDRSSLSLSMDVAAGACDVRVDVEQRPPHSDGRTRLRIACLYQGQPMTVDRVLDSSSSSSNSKRCFDVSAIAASLNRHGVLTVLVPKLRRKSTRRRLRVPVTEECSSTLQDRPSHPPPYNNTSNDTAVKRLELELPSSISAQDIQVLFDRLQNRLYISAKKPTGRASSTTFLFQRKFSINPRLVCVEHFQATLHKNTGHHNPTGVTVLVVTAPVRAAQHNQQPPHHQQHSTNIQRIAIAIQRCDLPSRSSSSSTTTTAMPSAATLVANDSFDLPPLLLHPQQPVLQGQQQQQQRTSSNTNYNSKYDNKLKPSPPSSSKHGITPAALALSQQNATLSSSTSAKALQLQGQLDYHILHHHILETTSSAAHTVSSMNMHVKNGLSLMMPSLS